MRGFSCIKNFFRMLVCFAVVCAAACSVGISAHSLYAEEAEDACPVFFTQGDRGAEIADIQKKLGMLGYDAGSVTGVYTLRTARAVKAFQEDCGLRADGICDAGVIAAIDARWSVQCGQSRDSASARASVSAETPDTDALLSALREAGCCSSPSDGELRNALLLFQRTHGLCGTGCANEATLSALGSIAAALHANETALAAQYRISAAREQARYAESSSDLRVRMLANALSGFVTEYPDAYDSSILSACAEVLLNRTRSPMFPDALSAVCAQGILLDPQRTKQRTAAYRSEAEAASDPLLLAAAENALRTFRTENTGAGAEDTAAGIARGALYVSYKPNADGESAPAPAPDRFCVNIGNFVFSRSRSRSRP